MHTRRDILGYAGTLALTHNLDLSGLSGEAEGPMRSVNVINFLRGVEPRGPMDLFLPLQKQMEISNRLGLPTTWLLQFDALVSGPFVDYLKAQMKSNHEVGIWFEMNEMHCNAAGVKWRGRPGYEWDHYPFVAFTIGYTLAERVKLADAFMAEFKKVWGFYPKSVASWNLDGFTMAHLCEKYGIDAFAVCRDQIATDGFTIWGAPFAGYFPSKTNCWSPALDRKNQIPAPVLKMLGQDPTYYYYRHGYPMPGGKRGGGPDTMEPVWPSGRSDNFIKNFLEMLSDAPAQQFAYAQLGQENNFGWTETEPGYEKQMIALHTLWKAGKLSVETLGETGRRFKKRFRHTPTQAQVMLNDSFGNTNRPEKSIWYQSRFYRANLHIKGDLPFFRDLTVYSDDFPQPYIAEPTTLHDVEQRMPAILDGYHWSSEPGSFEPKAGGFIVHDGKRVLVTGEPKVMERGNTMTVVLPTSLGDLVVRFSERGFTVALAKKPFRIAFEWDQKHAVLRSVTGRKVGYDWQGLSYSATTLGVAERTAKGWDLVSSGQVVGLTLAQPK